MKTQFMIKGQGGFQNIFRFTSSYKTVRELTICPIYQLQKTIEVRMQWFLLVHFANLDQFGGGKRLD